MRNPLVQSDLTLVQPNSSYLTKHVCFETWSLTLPSLFWWILMKNKSQLFRHLNIPFKSIFQGEFNGSFRFSIHSAKFNLFYKTYILFFLLSSLKFNLLFLFFLGLHQSKGGEMDNSTVTSLIFINKNMKTLLKTNPGQS